jgi:hypothetical protein
MGRQGRGKRGSLDHVSVGLRRGQVLRPEDLRLNAEQNKRELGGRCDGGIASGSEPT